MNRDTEKLGEEYRHGAITRREFFRRAALLGVSAGALQTILAACAPAQAPSSPAPAATSAAPAAAAPAAGATPMAVATAAPAAAAGQIKRGGTLTHAVNWTVPTMDPHLSSLREHLIYENVYDGLVRFQQADEKTAEQKVVGVLAESWEQKDARTLVFKLRSGVKFHDGSDFDADVAKWNFLRARDNPKSAGKANLEAIDTVTAVDKTTLEIKTKTDNAALLPVLAFPTGGMVRMISKAAVDKNGEEWLQRNPVGTGPFKFKEWITDDRVILERNPNYFLMGADGKSLPYLDGLVLRYVPDPSVSLVDMRAGQVHFIEWVPPSNVATIKSDPNLAYMEMPWAGQVYFELGFNTESKPFNDVKVRQAALYGIDREGMHKALGFGVGAPHYYPYTMDGVMGHDEKLLKYPYDPDKVKSLLKDAGYPNGVDVELKVIAREPENTIGEFVQQMWSAVGIKTKLVSQERLSWIDAVHAKNFQSCFWRGAMWAAVDPEAARTMITTGGAINWGQWSDKEIDKLMDDGLASLDPKKRTEIYHQVWQLIQERAYGGSGFLAPMIEGLRKEVKGIDINFQVPNFKSTWLG